MICKDFRPQFFREVAGNELAKEALKAIVRDKSKAPKVILLHGAYGSSKTTNSRIFAKAVNCLHPVDGEPCGECEVCKTPINEAIFYSEYDSAVVGNIDTIRELRDTFLYTVKGMTKVIVLDEIHVASKPAQTALLKVLEEAPDGVIFILATTHPHQLLPTIVSRSLEIPITRVSPADVIQNITTVSEKIGIEPSEKVKELIAYKSKGHMRDAHMLLDMYVLLGEESFIEAVKSSREYLTRYLVAILRKDKKYLEQALEGLMTIPVASIKDDWQQLLLDLAKEMTNPSDTPTGKIVKAFTAPNIMKLIKLSSGEWFESSFNNDVALQTYLLCIYQIFTK